MLCRISKSWNPRFPLFFLVCNAVVLVALGVLLQGCRSSSSASDSEWAVLVYMGGDNNLSDAAVQDLLEMESVGSTERVKVVVQMDLDGGRTAKRYLVQKGGAKQLADLGEVDMASPAALTDFLLWADDAYPAKRVMLVLWNHGNGWDQKDGPFDGTCPDNRSKARSLLYDDDNQSEFLPNACVKSAIQRAGVSVDILGFDASIMGTIEALYEFRDLSEIVISSQEVGESHGWDYHAILSELTATAQMDEETLAKLIVDSYKTFFEQEFYPSNPRYEQRHTIAAFRTSYFQPLANSVDSVAQSLMERMAAPGSQYDTLALIRNARAAVQEIDHYIQPYVYVDLVDLDRLLGGEIGAAQWLSRATIAEYHGQARPNAHGLSIVFFRLPEASDYGSHDANYRNYNPELIKGNSGEFIKSYAWDEFLNDYYELDFASYMQ